MDKSNSWNAKMYISISFIRKGNNPIKSSGDLPLTFHVTHQIFRSRNVQNRGSRRRNWEFRYVFLCWMNGFGDGDSGNAGYI